MACSNYRSPQNPRALDTCLPIHPWTSYEMTFQDINDASNLYILCRPDCRVLYQDVYLSCHSLYRVYGFIVY